MNKKKVGKFAFAYAVVVLTYYAFDFVYMPWLTICFGKFMIIPLYPSILLANFFGLFLYRIFNEDVLFIELGRNWISEESKRQWLERVKKRVRNSKKLTFIALSIYPSPIAGYLYFEKNEDSKTRIFRIMALGSVFCTLVWAGLFTVVWYVVVGIYHYFK